VILDVVYNHVGPAGSWLRSYRDDYFAPALKNAWGDALNFANPHLRAYVLDSIRMWLVDYRFDGLRFDAVHAIPDAAIVGDAVALARGLGRDLLIGEDDRNDPALVRELGLAALWADDFHHAVHTTLTGEQDGYYAAYAPGVQTIARAIERGWIYEGQVFGPSGQPRGRRADELPAESFVYCLQNHDQIGNRAFGDRLTAKTSIDAFCAASALLLFLPMTPMLFMGQEWAASTPFQYFTDHDAELGALISKGRRAELARFVQFASGEVPDPQDPATFARSVLRWEERDEPAHARVLALYQQLLRLRREDPVLRDAPRSQLAVRVVDGLLHVERWSGDERRLLVVNLEREARPLTGEPLFATRDAPAGSVAAESAAIVALPVRMRRT